MLKGDVQWLTLVAGVLRAAGHLVVALVALLLGLALVAPSVLVAVGEVLVRLGS